MTTSTRAWLLAHRSQCREMTQVELADLLGVTRQRIAQMCDEEGIVTTYYVSAAQERETTDRIRQDYQRALRSTPKPTSWKDVADALGVAKSTEAYWRERLTESDRQVIGATLLTNRIRRDGKTRHDEAADLLRAKPRHYTVPMLAKKMGVSAPHARMALNKAIRLDPRLDKLWVRSYLKGR